MQRDPSDIRKRNNEVWSLQRKKNKLIQLPLSDSNNNVRLTVNPNIACAIILGINILEQQTADDGQQSMKERIEDSHYTIIEITSYRILSIFKQY